MPAKYKLGKNLDGIKITSDSLRYNLREVIDNKTIIVAHGI
jgi:hypothetical protein